MSQKKQRRLKKEIETRTIPTEYEEPREKGMWRVIKRIVQENKLYLILMTLMMVAVFGNSLNGNFVSDDYASITQNQQIDSFGFMFGGGNSMSTGTFLMNKLFGPGSSTPYHVFSLINFWVFCVIAYIFLEVVFEKRWLTRLTMFLFVLHPIHVEAISWISGRIYLILGIYIMVGLLGFVFFVKENNPKYLWISLATFILGFLTDKPRPFAMLLLIFLYLISYGIKRVRIDWSKVVLGGLGISIVAILVAWPYIVGRINIVNSGYNASESIFYNPFFQYPTGISKYLQLLWFPIDLTLYHTMYVFPVWLNWLILIIYLAAIVYFYFKNKAYFFALSFIVVAVLPSIMPIKVSWLVAERYIFLGSLGFCLFLALLISDVSQYLKVFTPVLIGGIVSFYGVRLFLRNIDWQTNHNLWVNTCQVSPNSHNAWNNIGDDYDKLAATATNDKERNNQYMNAVKGFTQSTLVKPNYADAYHNRANIFFKMGRLDLARDSYNTAIYYSPELYQTYLSLTQIDLMENNLNLAINHAEQATKLQPENPQSGYVLAVVYAQAGRINDAKTILKNIVKAQPQYTPAVEALRQLEALPKP